MSEIDLYRVESKMVLLTPLKGHGRHKLIESKSCLTKKILEVKFQGLEEVLALVKFSSFLSCNYFS